MPDFVAEMIARTCTVILLIVVCCGAASALEPGEILSVTNKDIPESGKIARYYCQKRGVPEENILALSLGAKLRDTINRKDYNEQLAQPIRRTFFNDKLLGYIPGFDDPSLVIRHVEMHRSRATA